MNCPYCRESGTHVVETRFVGEDQSTRRRRECSGCDRRFTTYERVVPPSASVVKRDGSTEPFSREKLKHGIEKACKKRDVSSRRIASVIREVEDAVRERGVREIESTELGDMVLEQLRELDAVAYLRFASIYEGFDEVGEFERAARELTEDAGGERGDG